MTFTLTELRECAEREVNRRKRVYPNRLVTKRRKPGWCKRELAMMQEIAARLRELEQAEMLV